MLRNLLITSSSGGIVYFEKSWTHVYDEQKVRMVGGLITTIQQFSRQSTGMYLTNLKFQEMSVTLSIDDSKNLICTLFHDIEGEFTRLIASQILRSFIEEFQDSVDFKSSCKPAVFQSFNNKISEAITGCAQKILAKLKRQRGIKGAMLILDDGTELISGHVEEQIGIAANLLDLLEASTDIMQLKEDSVQQITLNMEKHTVFIHQFNDSSLVSICRNNVDQRVCIEAIEETVELLDKVMELASKLQGN